MTDAELIAGIASQFGDERRPEHFTDFNHCPECAEHDKLLLSRGRGELQPEDVSNSGWDPICFVTNDGFRYLVPDLVRVALLPVRSDVDWPFPNFLFHLTSGGERNGRLLSCTTKQRRSIVNFLGHMSATRKPELEKFFVYDEITPAIELWDRDA